MSFHARSHCDAIVVGARCAGAATAMLMARRGLRVLMVDRQPYGSDTLSTHALMRAAVLQLARWGLLDRLKAAGTPAIARTTFHYGAEAVALDIQPGDGVDALYAPRRTVLDPILVDAAREAGVDARFGVTVTDVVRADDGRVRGVVLVDGSGTQRTVTADLVVGADGVRSTIARSVGAPVEYQGRHACPALFGYWPGLTFDGSHWIYRPGLGAGAIPTNFGETCIFVGMDRNRYRAGLASGVEGLFRQTLAEVAPDLAARIADRLPTDRIRAFAGIPGFLRRPAGPGWALVGDAGYFKDPITAHGISDALRDAELLAEAAVEGSAAAFDRYREARKTLSMPLFEATETIARLDWTLDELKGHHIALSAAMKAEAKALAARPPIPGLPAAA